MQTSSIKYNQHLISTGDKNKISYPTQSPSTVNRQRKQTPLKIFIPLVPPHLRHIILYLLLLVPFANEEHVVGVDDDAILEALQHNELVVGRMDDTVAGIDDQGILTGNGIAEKIFFDIVVDAVPGAEVAPPEG
jgi:hypothetical protein